jgi:hypothetical protein
MENGKNTINKFYFTLQWNLKLIFGSISLEQIFLYFFFSENTSWDLKIAEPNNQITDTSLMNKHKGTVLSIDGKIHVAIMNHFYYFWYELIEFLILQANVHHLITCQHLLLPNHRSNQLILAVFFNVSLVCYMLVREKKIQKPKLIFISHHYKKTE